MVLRIILTQTACNPYKIKLSQSNNDSIEKYLYNKVIKPSFGGKVFSSYKVLGTEENKIYVWAYLQEYFKQEGKITKGTGWSVPLILNVDWQQDQINIINYEAPRDGDYYAEDIRKYFPKAIQKIIINFPESKDIKELEATSQSRSKAL